MDRSTQTSPPLRNSAKSTKSSVGNPRLSALTHRSRKSSANTSLPFLIRAPPRKVVVNVPSQHSAASETSEMEKPPENGIGSLGHRNDIHSRGMQRSVVDEMMDSHISGRPETSPGCKPTNKPATPGRMFTRQKTSMTKGEQGIISGIFQNRGDLPIQRETEYTLYSTKPLTHKDAWLVKYGKTHPHTRQLQQLSTSIKGIFIAKGRPQSLDEHQLQKHSANNNSGMLRNQANKPYFNWNMSKTKYNMPRNTMSGDSRWSDNPVVRHPNLKDLPNHFPSRLTKRPTNTYKRIKGRPGLNMGESWDKNFPHNLSTANTLSHYEIMQDSKNNLLRNTSKMPSEKQGEFSTVNIYLPKLVVSHKPRQSGSVTNKDHPPPNTPTTPPIDNVRDVNKPTYNVA